MTRTKSTYLALLAVLLSPMAVHADLIEGLCDGTVDATVTCDTGTGLEWLDLTETEALELSVNDFLADVGGFVSDGWSWAMTATVDQLFLNAGAVDITGNVNPGNDPAIALLIDLLGSIDGCSQEGFGACGFTDDGSGLATIVLAYDSRSSGIWGGTGLGSVNLDYSQSGIGIFAYRASEVPEPGTLALLGIGLAAMGLSRRRKQLSQVA